MLKIVVIAVAGVALVLMCNTNRGALIPVQGVPYVVLVVLGVLAVWSFLLARTRFGRYLYAIGNSAEAARRAGISLGWNKLWAFTLTGLTSGDRRHRLRLPARVDLQQHRWRHARALRGGRRRHRRGQPVRGRGKMVYALLGGIVIATIYNGMGLLGLAASYQYMVTALVLLAAVTIDSLARRGRTATD